MIRRRGGWEVRAVGRGQWVTRKSGDLEDHN